MIVIKLKKNISLPEGAGIFLGKSKIDSNPIYKFESFEEFWNTGLKADECQMIPNLEDSDLDKMKEFQLKI